MATRLARRRLARAALVSRASPSGLDAVPSGAGTFMGLVRESFPGAWQQGVEISSRQRLLAFAAVYASVSIIASDIAKLGIRLMRVSDGGVWQPVREATPFMPVLRRPNHYQTPVKFIEQWMVSKLLHGNTYSLKVRDQRRIVTSLYVLDPRKVTPLVASDGSIYYRLGRDPLSKLDETVDDTIVPASEIIHDTMVSLWHPLVGVSPIYACGLTGTMGGKILENSAKFFENMSRPSGMLTAPGEISDPTAARLKQYWEQNYSAANLGRLAVLGDGLKYEPMTIPAQDAQLIEQLRWTVEDVARAFHLPLYKLGAGQMPSYNNAAALNLQYYMDCLQILIESFESLMDHGLNLPDWYGVELNVDNLLRMDPQTRFKAYSDAIGGGWFAPNEAREREGMPPVIGGSTPYMQQQNYSLAALARRDEAASLPAASSDGASQLQDDQSLDEEQVERALMIARDRLAIELEAML